MIPHAGVGSSRNFNHKQAICNFTTKIHGLERFSHVEERLNILGLETLNWRRVILDLIFLCYKYLQDIVEIDKSNFMQTSTTRCKGMKLHKKQCKIDARHQFFSNHIVDIWNSLPAAVVLSPSVAVLNEI